MSTKKAWFFRAPEAYRCKDSASEDANDECDRKPEEHKVDVQCCQGSLLWCVHKAALERLHFLFVVGCGSAVLDDGRPAPDDLGTCIPHLETRRHDVGVNEHDQHSLANDGHSEHCCHRTQIHHRQTEQVWAPQKAIILIVSNMKINQDNHYERNKD
eukprot:838661-Prymnesium_polylepis.1